MGVSDRLIPARAGNTLQVTAQAFITAAHPRSRGEHFVVAHGVQFRCGSSPLARGTLHDALDAVRAERLIPARAGNTSLTCASLLAVPAHPRSRGEHADAQEKKEAVEGSSPLARGTLINADDFVHGLRLIPARAGNTALCRLSCRLNAAHPRSRGEHLANSLKLCYVTGSSPLARGTLLIFGAGAGIPRLIPARAGNTDPRKQVGDSVTAHPRSRGEHYAKNPISSIRNGSSPLARGTLR